MAMSNQAKPEPQVEMQAKVQEILTALGSVVLGKPRQLKQALCCLLAGGHLLIEDLPGMGKTTLAHALAQVLGLSFNRLQFTSDLLPADVIGASIFRPQDGSFSFQPGPVFTQVLLADEINRATPKAQSSLLEAMEEHQVSVDGTTHELPNPFFVIATQNPLQQTGTYPLPESQLDRFLMRIELGYPDPKAERAMLSGGDPRQRLQALESVIDLETLEVLQFQVDRVQLSEPLLDYVMRLVDYSRQHSEFSVGLSPRGALALVRCAQAWALVAGRDYVIPEDVQEVLPNVAEHRLRGSHGATHSDFSRQLIEAVAVLS